MSADLKSYLIEANWADASTGKWLVLRAIESEDPNAAFEAMKARATDGRSAAEARELDRLGREALARRARESEEVPDA